MTTRVPRFPNTRLAARIQSESNGTAGILKARGCTKRQSDAIQQAVMFSLAAAEYQRLACRHIDRAFPRKVRTKIQKKIQSAAAGR